MLMDGELNLKQFKELVLEDYRLALLGREARRVALAEADWRPMTSGFDVAQVALARFAEASDAFVPSGVDLTASFAKGDVSLADFFRSVFSPGADSVCHDSVGRLSVASGLALASASGGAADRRVAVCTVSGASCRGGVFYETVAYAAARSLPLCIVVWNDAAGASGGSIIRQLGGFCMSSGGRKTLVMESVKGGDYPALCRVLRQQFLVARGGATALTVVSRDEADVDSFAEWIVGKQIASRGQVDDVGASVRQEVERQRRAAYLVSVADEAPERRPRRSLMNIDSLCSASALPVMRMPADAAAVNKAIGVACSGTLPIVEASAADVSSSLFAAYPGHPVIVRSVAVEAGAFLVSSPPSAEVYAPASRAEAAGVYSSLFARPRQAVVIEPGFDAGGTGGEGGGTPAALLSEGEDATIVSFGAATHCAERAAALLATQRLRADVVHLGSLRPLDPDGLVAASLRKTKRLVVVDTDPSGLSARLVVASLALGGEALRHLMAAPAVVAPASAAKPVEPHEVCLAVAKLVG